MAKRYSQLLNVIAKFKPKTIIEVGTWNGHRATEMARVALKHQPKVHYTGYDLFEHGTKELDKEEFNVKPNHSVQEVTARLLAFQQKNPGFSFTLVPGNTRQTLCGYVEADFAFIDGGHSIETIRNDFAALWGCHVVAFDDHYMGDLGPEHDVTKVGSNQMVKQIRNQGHNIRILPVQDPIKGTKGYVQIALLVNPRKPQEV